MGRKLFANNTAYKLGAILFAAALWIWVGVQDNPMDNKVLLVPVEYTNLSSGQMLVSAEQFVNVRVEGRRGDLELITSRDVTATVDLSEGQPGDNALQVRVRPPSEVQVIDVNPGTVDVVLDSVETVQWQVEPVITGTLATGYVHLDPRIEPAEVLVEGPVRLLDRLESVEVDIRLDGDSTYQRTLPLRAFDDQRQDITDLLRFSPSDVAVRLPIYARGRLVEKPVHVPLVGSPRTGFKVVAVDLDPRFVVVTAETLAVRDVLAFPTEPLNISGADETFSETVRIDTGTLPLVVTPSEVTVVVVIERE